MNSGKKIFSTVIEILNNNEIFYWLDQGTLLGYVRDNNLIKGDSDIDISVWEKDFYKILCIKQLFIDKGFYFEFQDKYDAIFLSKGKEYYIEIAKQRVVGDYVYRNNNCPQTTSSAKFIKILLKMMPGFIHFRLRDFARRKSSNKPLIAKTPLSYFSNFEKVLFLGIGPLYIPHHSEDYLMFKYGKDWQIPNKDWNYKECDGSILFGKQLNE